MNGDASDEQKLKDEVRRLQEELSVLRSQVSSTTEPINPSTKVFLISSLYPIVYNKSVDSSTSINPPLPLPPPPLRLRSPPRFLRLLLRARILSSTPPANPQRAPSHSPHLRRPISAIHSIDRPAIPPCGAACARPSTGSRRCLRC